MIPGTARTSPPNNWARAYMPVLRSESGQIVAYSPHPWPTEEEALMFAKFLKPPVRRQLKAEQEAR